MSDIKRPASTGSADRNSKKKTRTTKKTNEGEGRNSSQGNNSPSEAQRDRDSRDRGLQDRDRDRYRDDYDDRGEPYHDEAPRRAEPSTAAPPAKRGGEERYDDDEPYDDRGEKDSASAPLKAPPRGTAVKPFEEYSIHVYYDRQTRQFIATVLEFPDLRVNAQSREEALTAIQDKLEPHYQNLFRRGDPVPEPYFSRSYPEKIEVHASQGLFRKLDVLSRQEKTPLDQLVTELLTAAVEKRFDGGRQGQRAQHQGGGQGQSQQRGGGNRHQQQGHQRHQHQGKRGHGRSRDYHETMDNRENFMEYVRNLEKGNFRKK